MANDAKNITWQSANVTREIREKLLNQKGQIFWFTGLSGSGKSTIAINFEKKLHEMKKLTYLLDGDNIRYGLNTDLGFSEKDRTENIRRIAEVAKLFYDAGLIVLVSFISPYRNMREFARKLVPIGIFKEVYVKADLHTCIKRDPKGIYAKALKGDIPNFTGISAPYEEPEHPDFILDSNKLSIDESVNILLSALIT